MEALGLFVLAVVLARAVPPVLARAAWPARDPRAGLVLWQSVGLGGGLAVLGAGVTLAVADTGRPWLPGLAAVPATVVPGGGTAMTPLGWLGAAVTLVAGTWLFSVLIATTRRVLRVRRAHRERLDLVTDDFLVREDGGRELALVQLLDHADTAAYCLPGVRPRIVLSSGTVAALSPGQLAAVVAHERAHARGRHDLVIHPFRAWRDTLPFLPAAATGLSAVTALVEMLADDAARRRYGVEPLVEALRRLAAGAPGDPEIAARLARLESRPRALPPFAAASVYLTAVALVVAPPLILALS